MARQVKLLLFSTLGQAALLSLINRLENGERVTVGLGVEDGGKRFLHLLAVRFLLALPLIIIGAERAVVIEQQPIFKSLSLGASLFIKQIGDFIIIGLLFIVGALAAILNSNVWTLAYGSTAPHVSAVASAGVQGLPAGVRGLTAGVQGLTASAQGLTASAQGLTASAQGFIAVVQGFPARGAGKPYLWRTHP